MFRVIVLTAFCLKVLFETYDIPGEMKLMMMMILLVFAQFLWTLNFIFSSSYHGKYFLVLYEEIICSFSF